MQVSSPAFEDGQPIPRRFTCDGEGLSPPVQFSDVAADARSLALVYEDSDAHDAGRTLLVVWNLPPDTRELAEGDDPRGLGAAVGENSWGRNEHTAPCPETGTHRYILRAYALDTELDLPDATTGVDLRQAMEGHVLGTGQWMGTCSRT